MLIKIQVEPYSHYLRFSSFAYPIDSAFGTIKIGEIKRDLKRIYATNYYANFNFSLSYEGRILGDLENLEETRIPHGGTVILTVQGEPSRNLWIQPPSNPPRSRSSIAQRFSRWVNWADSKTTLPKPNQLEEPESIETLRQNLDQAQAQIASLKIQLENFKNEDVCIICLDKKRNLLFIPCSHLICCETCGMNVFVSIQSCSVCRTKITGVLKVFK